MRRVLLPLFLLATGCGENLTEPVREDYRTREPEPLACLPNLDEQIDSSEIQPAIGVDVRYLISPDGTTREVDVAGRNEGELTIWDFSVDYADDQVATVTPDHDRRLLVHGVLPERRFRHAFRR